MCKQKRNNIERNKVYVSHLLQYAVPFGVCFIFCFGLCSFLFRFPSNQCQKINNTLYYACRQFHLFVRLNCNCTIISAPFRFVFRVECSQLNGKIHQRQKECVSFQLKNAQKEREKKSNNNNEMQQPTTTTKFPQNVQLIAAKIARFHSLIRLFVHLTRWLNHYLENDTHLKNIDYRACSTCDAPKNFFFTFISSANSWLSCFYHFNWKWS